MASADRRRNSASAANRASFVEIGSWWVNEGELTHQPQQKNTGFSKLSKDSQLWESGGSNMIHGFKTIVKFVIHKIPCRCLDRLIHLLRKPIWGY